MCKAAHDFDPLKYPDVPFGAFARIGVRKHLFGLKCRTATKHRVWFSMPASEDEFDQSFCEPADHRGDDVHPQLRAWCSDEYRRQRRVIPWRNRLILYLRYVESWTLEEVGDALQITRERVRQLESRSIARLAENRVAQQVANSA